MNSDRAIVYEIVTVLEAAKRQIIYCSARKSAGRRTERDDGRWKAKNKGSKARASCYACIECNRDMQPQQQGREHAACTKCDIRTGQFPSFIINDT